MKRYFISILALILIACQTETHESSLEQIPQSKTFITILGVAQDGGVPHIACRKDCCKKAFQKEQRKKVVCLGLYDAEENSKYLFEATPNLPQQIHDFNEIAPNDKHELVDGVFLTHAHIGHYIGLAHFGKEAKDAKEVPVFAMPRMKEFLENNGPWDQLVKRKNIIIQSMNAEEEVLLSSTLSVTPILVPHRDEYSETVGYRIQGPKKSALFIPDIDKWEKWENDIVEEINKVDYAFLDATFYDAAEVNHRDINQIPHPFVIESLEKFKALKQKEKVYFIHFNHTNPLLNNQSTAFKIVTKEGFQVAQEGMSFGL